jgi:hypothetical protein
MEQLAKTVGQIETKMESLATEAVLQSDLQTDTSAMGLDTVDPAMKDFTKELGIMKTAIHTMEEERESQEEATAPKELVAGEEGATYAKVVDDGRNAPGDRPPRAKPVTVEKLEDIFKKQ